MLSCVSVSPVMHNSMKPIHIVVIALLIVLLSLYYRLNPLVSKVRIGNAVFTVEVAATEVQKQNGLGGRVSMPEAHGMLFPYDHKEQYEFWMKGMQFPLDFIWIDGKTITDIEEFVPPPMGSERPIIVKPSVAVDKVLEVNAGTVARIGIKVGDTVEYIDR